MKKLFWQTFLFLVVIASGIAIGLYYGWVINPATPQSTSISALRIDYQTDFALMTAELYHAQPDLTLAMGLLNHLQNPPSISMMNEFIAYAEANNYAHDDILLLQNLASSLLIEAPCLE